MTGFARGGGLGLSANLRRYSPSEPPVRLAVGTDYNACPPIKGIRHGGGEEEMLVDITIDPVQ